MQDSDQGQPAFEGALDGSELSIAVVQARFNDAITSSLASACLAELSVLGVPAEAIRHITVPGALEVPLALQALAETNDYDALIALGCIIRGETYHFELVAHETARGLQDLGIGRRLPIGFGVLAVDDEAQAWARAKASEGDRGGGAAKACLETIALKRQLLGQSR